MKSPCVLCLLSLLPLSACGELDDMPQSQVAPQPSAMPSGASTAPTMPSRAPKAPEMPPVSPQMPPPTLSTLVIDASPSEFFLRRQAALAGPYQAHEFESTLTHRIPVLALTDGGAAQVSFRELFPHMLAPSGEVDHCASTPLDFEVSEWTLPQDTALFDLTLTDSSTLELSALSQEGEEQLAFTTLHYGSGITEFNHTLSSEARDRCDRIWGTVCRGSSTRVDHTWEVSTRAVADVSMRRPARCEDPGDRTIWAVEGFGTLDLHYEPLDATGASLQKAINWAGSEAFTFTYPEDSMKAPHALNASPQTLSLSFPQGSSGTGELKPDRGQAVKVMVVTPDDVASVDLSLYAWGERLSPDSSGILTTSTHAPHVFVGVDAVRLKGGARACNFTTDMEIDIATPNLCQISPSQIRAPRHPHSTFYGVVFEQPGLCEFTVHLPQTGQRQRFNVRMPQP